MNYGQLKAALASRLSRTDLTAAIPDFVTLGEMRLYYGFKDAEIEVRPLRIRAMLASETTSLATLPTDFLALHRFTVPATYGTLALKYKTPEEFAALPSATTYQQYYTFQDGGVTVQGAAPAGFIFSYYKKFAALAVDADTNWLLTNYPNVYFYSALIEAYAHLKDDARIQLAARMFSAAANGLIDSDQAERHSGSVLTVGSSR